jgi:hypothetical protein
VVVQRGLSAEVEGGVLTIGKQVEPNFVIDAVEEKYPIG